MEAMVEMEARRAVMVVMGMVSMTMTMMVEGFTYTTTEMAIITHEITSFI